TDIGGQPNPAAGGVDQPSAGGAGGGAGDTGDGDFPGSGTDLSIPTFGPGLDFPRTYDSQTAEDETRTVSPGPLGFGWSDNWATSLTTGSPVPGDIYSLDGLATDTGD